MNSISRSPLSSKLLLFIILCNIISFIDVRILNIYSTFGTYGNLIILFLIFIVQNRINREEQKFVMYLLFFISYSLLTLFITSGGFGSVVTPIYSMLVFWILKRSKLNYRIMSILTFALIGVNLFWVINSYGYYQKFLFNRNDYINSNTIGMLLMYTAIYIKIFTKWLKWKKSTMLRIIIDILTMWGILNCQARGSLITFIIFIIFDSLIPKNFWKKKQRVTIIVGIIIFIGLLIPYVYTLLFTRGFNYIIPIVNKPLYTGRQVIWANFYNEIKKSSSSLLFGLGSKADLWEGHSLNLHNNYLGVIANFGIIGFGLYYGLLVKLVSNVYKYNPISNYQVSLVVGFICVLINGYIEISTLWFNMFFFNFMFLGFATDNRKQNIASKVKG